MNKTYRGRMMAGNFSAFLLVFCLILIIALQGGLYHQITKSTNDLHQHAQNADLYLKEEASLDGSLRNYAQYLAKHANTFVKSISQTNGHRTILLNANAEVLGDSAVSQSMDFSGLCAQVRKKAKPVYSMTILDQADTLIYAAPLKLNEEILGFVVFTVPADTFYSPIHAVSLFLLLGICLSLPILLFCIWRFSDYAVKPIVDLTRITRQINEGNYNVSIAYPLKDEIGELTETFNTMIQNINAAILQLHSERDRLAAVLASLDDGLLVVDQKGNILTINAHIRTFFNVANPKSIYDFQFQSFLRDIFDDLKNGKEHISLEINRNNRDLMIIGSPIRNAGFEENFLFVIRNTTAMNRIKQEQQKFISSVSHELRTPLTTIIGYTDMITRRQLSENEIVTRSLTTINKEGHRLLRLVDDLLDVDRLDRPEFSIKKTNLDLQQLLLDVIDQMKMRSLEKEIDILYKSDLKKIEVLGDYDRLQQVFINLLHNAIKYSDSGAIIEVIATIHGEQIAVSVRDYGIGISEDEQQKIFSAFYRVEEDRARSEGEGGAGLGLYLVRQIILQHQGNIDVKSIPGEGTNITITLPTLITRIVQEDEHDQK